MSVITNQDYLQYLTNNTWPVENVSPIHRGEGIYFWDYNGKKYMDFSSQTLNLLLGQCHPVIVDALISQAKTLTYASSRFGSLPYLKTAKKLAEIAPKGLTRVNIKMCDGSDANETAVKVARKFTGKTGIISFHQGHTGQTTQTIQLRGYGRDPRTLAGNKEDIVFVHPPKCQETHDYENTIIEIKQVIQKHGNIAAILVDPVMTNAGVLVTDETQNYLKEINALTKEHNILFVLDENQTFGWVPKLFATNYYDLSPDIITLGKGLSAGHPLAGVLLREELKDVLDYNEADFTHGGHVLTCSAAYACLSLIGSEDFHIQEKEALMKVRLGQLKNETTIDVISRGVGLIHCIEIVESQDIDSSKLAEIIFNEALNEGLFLRKYGSKLVLKPPIIVNNIEIIEAFEILERVFRKVSKQWK